MSLFPQTDMAKEYGELCKKNVKVSREVCRSVISQAFASLEKALNNGSYMRSGGYEDFRCELDRGAQLYRSEKRKGVMVSSTECVCACVLQERNSSDYHGNKRSMVITSFIMYLCVYLCV